MANLTYDFLQATLRSGHNNPSDTYLSSPLYFMLTGRRGTWCFEGHDSSMIMCAHPHVDQKLMVFPEQGSADYRLTSSVLNTIAPPKNGVQLARFRESDLERLQTHLATSTLDKPINVQQREETIMDWLYPSHILSTQTVSTLEGKNFVKIRNKFRQASNVLSCTPIDPANDMRSMRAALKFWEGNMICFEKETEDMSEFYEELFRVLHDNPSCAQGLLIHSGRRPVGFTIWDEPYKETANLLVNLGDTSINGLSDYQMIQACRLLVEQGVQRLNLGGSELQSLDDFKRKYQPETSLSLLSADVEYEAPKRDFEFNTLIRSDGDISLGFEH